MCNGKHAIAQPEKFLVYQYLYVALLYLFLRLHEEKIFGLCLKSRILFFKFIVITFIFIDDA